MLSTNQMTVVPFRLPARTLANMIEQNGSLPNCDITLSRGKQTRRFHIRRGHADGQWYCHIWHGSLQHRGATVSIIGAQTIRKQYQQEITALVADGWKEASM